jgi:hypothetical protein
MSRLSSDDVCNARHVGGRGVGRRSMRRTRRCYNDNVEEEGDPSAACILYRLICMGRSGRRVGNCGIG